jgi:nicotinate-nucleotide pyrophosphorylase (carboxylating)
MNWFDEGALFSQIGVFLREDMGRGDITTQSIITRNTRARGRFVAGESMIVAGLEAVEEVFLLLDSQQQLEAFVSDGEHVEAGKVIARTVGFADVLITAERVALNLLQRLSGVATLTNQFVKAVEGTKAQIVDTRATTPGLRLLEKYAVELGGGHNSRFGLDDGVVVTANHIAIIGNVSAAVAEAKKQVGHLHRIFVEVSSENDARDAVVAGADILIIHGLRAEEVQALVKLTKELSESTVIQCSGSITLENVHDFATAGADFISIAELTSSAPARNIGFNVQTY